MPVPRFELPPIPNRFSWLFLAAMALPTFAIGVAQGFTMAPRAFFTALMLLTLTLTIAHVYTAYRPQPLLAIPAALIAFFVGNGIVFGTLGYFVASFELPLIDAQLAAIDRFLGLDWHAAQRATAESRTLSMWGTAIYHASGLQIFLVWIVLGFTGQMQRLSVFLTTMVLSTAVCIVLSGLMPAIGAYPFYGVATEQLGYLKGTEAGVWHMTDFAGLRDGSFRVVDLSKLEGIVTFPSYHTVVAAMCGWALLKTRWIGIPSAIYSFLVVLTTVPIGGHHYIDVIAGLAVTVASIALAWRIERAGTAERAPALLAAD